MAELRSVDPRILQANPDNPRRTPVSPAMDEQLLASIKAIGIIQPPIVVEKDGALVINAGNRRVKQAIRADFAAIDVLVCDADEARDLMRSLAENLIRASMNSVDIWRGIDTLENKGSHSAIRRPKPTASAIGASHARRKSQIAALLNGSGRPRDIAGLP
jgi:ParB/RepB/Spo0J family partition protein